jgi:N-acetylmuramoyl-L-alanine amidase
MTTTLTGKCSWFGGPEDMGVSPSEGLAFISSVSQAPELFLPKQPPNTTGLARRLDPSTYYIATRWDYAQYPKSELLDMKCLVTSPKTGKSFVAAPADWGPHVDTGRVADLSPGLMDALGIKTDDVVEVTFPYDEGEKMVAIAMSSGHGKLVRGAKGYLDEVDEARKVVAAVADFYRAAGVTVNTFNDDTSTTQNMNLKTIVDWHNRQQRDLDISVHFNCYQTTSKPMGTEVLYVTQSDLAAQVAKAMSVSGGFPNRGAKKRTDLYFLNNTAKPAILLEVCFVDSSADTANYRNNFSAICKAIAETTSGVVTPVPPEPLPPEVPEPVPPAEQVVSISITAPPGVIVNVTQQQTGGAGHDVLLPANPNTV